MRVGEQPWKYYLCILGDRNPNLSAMPPLIVNLTKLKLLVDEKFRLRGLSENQTLQTKQSRTKENSHKTLFKKKKKYSYVR